MNAPIRPAAVAGLFYPGQAATLRHDLAAMLDSATAAREAWAGPAPKALIVPHAGYVYSGSTAAAAYARLAGTCERIRRVVLLGPVHRVAVRGLATSSVQAFATPLGEVPLDRVGIATLTDLPQVSVHDGAHAPEHSLEVQLPFLQTVLPPGFTLLPLAVGDASAEQVARVLECVWGGPETLIVVSSDLSHYHRYDEARRLDAATAERILALQPLNSFDQACGALPINGLLAVARQRGLRVERLAQCTSGDTAGDKNSVVGYASFALYEPATETPKVGAGGTASGIREAPLCADAGPRRGNAKAETEHSPALGAVLLTLARRAIADRLGVAGPTACASDPPALAQPGATFVTLMLDGQLRGCIGSLEASRPLTDDVRANAIAAAFRDPRFPPLGTAEWPRLRVEVSLLTPARPIAFTDEADARRQLRPGIDGVIFQLGARRATFLPQVWEQLPEPRDFLAHLKLKAGVAADYWSPEVRLYRYEVSKWKQNETSD